MWVVRKALGGTLSSRQGAEGQPGRWAAASAAHGLALGTQGLEMHRLLQWEKRPLPGQQPHASTYRGSVPHRVTSSAEVPGRLKIKTQITYRDNLFIKIGTKVCNSGMSGLCLIWLGLAWFWG